MVKKRRNHGHPKAAGTLAARAVAQIVPVDRLRLTRVQIAWPEVAPGKLRRVAWPAALDRDTLTVHVVDNQWLHELMYMRVELLSRVKSRCPQAEVASLRLRVGEVPEPWPEPPPVPEAPVSCLPDEPARDTIEALTAVGDADLRQSMANARMALSRRLRR